jgi:glycosyltransferase involved in cell wall biosynthesis
MVRVAVNVEQLLHEAPGGIGRYTAELVRLLPGLGVDVTPFTARHSPAQVEAALAAHGLTGLDPVILPLPAPVLYDAWHLPGLANPVRRVAPVDLVHAPSPAVPPTGKVPLVVTVHDAAPITMPEAFTKRGVYFHRSGFRAAAKRATLVIAVSEFSADEVAAHTPIRRDQIRVVHNGVNLEPASVDDVARVRETFGLGDQPYVFWAGTHQPRKNVRVLLDSFTRLRDEVPHRLVLAGPKGWLADGEDGAVARALGDQLRLLGPVDRHDIFPFPSRHEGFGIPVLEAMAQDTAVVCSDIPALREVGGDAAEFVLPDDVDAWVEVFRDLLLHDDARRALADRGRARVQGFSWPRCAAETAAVYAEALTL